jgi:ABC-type transport system substrate-binding protein
MDLGVSYLSFDLRGTETPGVSASGGAHPNPFQHLGVREALARALDLERLRRGFGTRALVPSQLVTPLVLGFAPDLPGPVADRTAAARLLSQTPFPRGFKWSWKCGT